jgi:hypothetical protein
MRIMSRSAVTTIVSSYQNWPSEPNCRTAMVNMRAILNEAGLRLEFRDEAVDHDAYISN